MTTELRLKQEWRLRERLTDLLIHRGFEREVFFLDLFSFLDDYQELSPLQIRAIWDDYINGRREDAQVSLYLHVPFCRCRCDFCRYHQWLYRNDAQMDLYTESLCQELVFFRETFQGLKFQSLYMGGGTPNLLSADQLRRVFQTVEKNFRIRPQGERTVECNPFDTTCDKLAVLNAYGINSVSFGVQSGDAGMLNAMNRGYQSFSMVDEAVAMARKFGSFKRVNADLIIGLSHDTARGVFESFCRVADLGVDTISVYPLTPQRMYLKNYYQDDQLQFDQELRQKMLEFEALVVPEAKRRGFVHAPMAEAFRSDTWGFASKRCYESGWIDVSLYSSSVNGANYLGIGVGAASNIMGTVLYKNEGLDISSRDGTYFSMGTQYRLRHCRTEDSRKLWFIFQGLARFNEVSRVDYTALFGTDVVKDYRKVFESVLAIRGSEEIAITDQAVSFRTKTPREKFICALFFLDNRTVYRLTQRDSRRKQGFIK